MKRELMRQRIKLFVGLVGLSLLLIGCTRPRLDLDTIPTHISTTISQAAAPAQTAEVQPISTDSITPAAVATHAPTTTPTPPPTATLPPTATPTPTPTPTHPLMIEVMRQQSYPGSELTFEQTLAPGSNYDRYVVSSLSEGNKIYALLTIPWGERPSTGWPVIIFNHGYIPPAEYRTTERYVAYVDGFARNGYIVFRSDYRGHGSSEGEATGGYSTPAYTIDVLNGVTAVKSLAATDPDRIGMWGHSMGGYITLRSMVVSNEIKAGVIWAGVVGPYPDLFVRQNLNSAGGIAVSPTTTPGRGRWRQLLIESYGSPEENPLFWASISANAYLLDLSGPLQLHHGTADSSVPLAASETLQAQMEAAGMYSELYVYEGDNHNLSLAFNTAMQRSIAFFDTHVKGQR